MSITIKSEYGDVHMNINFDTFGNLYFGNSHQINIDGKNVPYAEKGEYEITQKIQYKFGSFSLINNENSLSKRVKDEQITFDSDEENSPDEENYFFDDTDHMNNEENENSNSGSFDEDNINNYGRHNVKFVFNILNDSIKIDINDRINGDIMALYDTYIYDDKLLFKSNSSDDSSIGRFRIFTNGTIYFRMIGYPESKYTLQLQNDNLLFIPG